MSLPKLLYSSLSAASLCLAACAGASSHPNHGAVQGAGDPDAAPSLRVLPEPVSAPAAVSDRVHQGFALASQVFDAALPPPPTDHSSASLQAWVDKTVAPWIEKRRSGIDDVSYEFKLNDQAAPSQGVMARAVLGLLQEDTALSLERIPPPAELDKEPEIASMFVDLIRTQAKPFMTAALTDYQQCADQGDSAGDDLTRWAEFCRARFERLHGERVQ